MKWNVELRPKALRDYFSIMDYLSLFYPSTPKNFDQSFEREKRRLEENPYSWSVCPSCPDFRRAIVGKYMVLYKIDEQQRLVHIHRILRSSWNIPHHLTEEET